MSKEKKIRFERVAGGLNLNNLADVIDGNRGLNLNNLINNLNQDQDNNNINNSGEDSNSDK